MKDLISKSATLKELPAGDEGNLIISFGKVGEPDLYGDLFEEGAYKATRNGKVVLANWNHARGNPVGVGTIDMVGDEAVWSGNFLNTQEARDVRESLIAMGPDAQYSYSFIPVKYYENEADWTYTFEEVEVFEVSPVYKAATPSSHTIGLKSYEDWRKEAHTEPAAPVTKDNHITAYMRGLIVGGA